MKKISMLAMGLLVMASCATAQDVQLPVPDMNVKMTLMEALQKRASHREYSDREISDATLSLLNDTKYIFSGRRSKLTTKFFFSFLFVFTTSISRLLNGKLRSALSSP